MGSNSRRQLIMNISYGASADKFGDQDYFQMLKSIWDTNDPGSDRQRLLADKRQEVLDWMGQEGNIDKIGEGNRLGVEGGLGERIASGDLTHRFLGTSGAGGTDWIGHADVMAGRAAGHSWGDIQGYLDQNTSQLQGSNVRGGGGLYDQVKAESRMENYQQDNNFDNLIESFQNEFDTSRTQQREFEQRQMDWQQSESEAQRAHESAMLEEQRKVRSATPTHVKNPVSQLAIGPGKVAAPQSASSLARKRLGSAPLVTGLNIGSNKTSMNIK